jgi:hypothetical protein
MLTNSLLGSLESTNESVSVQEAWGCGSGASNRTGKAVTVPWEELHRELLAVSPQLQG